jgi:hypothetical protein
MEARLKPDTFMNFPQDRTEDLLDSLITTQVMLTHQIALTISPLIM